MKRFLVGVIALATAESGLAQNLEQSLIQGAWSGQAMAVQSVLPTGRVDIDSTTVDGDTPLMLASLAGHESVVDILLEAGADPNLTNESGETALILASKYGFTAVAASVIEAGADVNARDSSRRNALTWVNWGETDSTVQLLQASGSDGTGKKDPFDRGTPVHRFERTPEMTKYKELKMPKALKKTDFVGKLEMRVVVDRSGKLKSVELVEGMHDELDENILDAAKKWRFQPGEIQGKPLEVS